MQQLLAAAEDLVEMGSWELDLETGELLWSDGLYRLQGYEPGEVEPDLDLVYPLIHPEDRDRVQSLVASVIEDPEKAPDPQTFEYRFALKHGRVVFVRARGRLLSDEAGRPGMWIGTVQDVTEQRLAESELRAHIALHRALREWESFDLGAHALLEQMATALDYPMAALWTRLANGDLQARVCWCSDRIDGRTGYAEVVSAARLESGEGIPGRALGTRQVCIVDDLGSRPGYELPGLVNEVGIRAAVGVPVIADDEVLAVLSFEAPGVRTSRAQLRDTLEGVGAELGRFLSRRRAEFEPSVLSVRELEVLRLAAGGNSGPEIAERLVVAPATIKTHFEHIYDKLGVSDRAAAVAYALRTGLID